MDQHFQEERDRFLAEAAELLAAGDYDEVCLKADERLLAVPGDPDALLAKANACFRLMRLDEATKIATDLDGRFLNWARAYEELGDTAAKLSLHLEALQFYRRAQALRGEEAPDSSAEEPSAEEAVGIAGEAATITLADLYLSQGHRSEAREILKRVVAREPWNAEALRRLEEFEEEAAPAGMNLEAPSPEPPALPEEEAPGGFEAAAEASPPAEPPVAATTLPEETRPLAFAFAEAPPAAGDAQPSAEGDGEPVEEPFSIELADRFLAAGDNGKAREILEKIIEDDPWNAGALERLEKLYSSGREEGRDHVAAELERWLAKLERLRPPGREARVH